MFGSLLKWVPDIKDTFYYDNYSILGKFLSPEEFIIARLDVSKVIDWLLLLLWIPVTIEEIELGVCRLLLRLIRF